MKEPVTVSGVFMTLKGEAMEALAKMLGNDKCTCVEEDCKPAQCKTCRKLKIEDVPPIEITIPRT